MMQNLSVALGVSIVFVVCIFGIVFGRSAERYGAICILSANTSAELIIAVHGASYPTAEIFAIDFMLAVALLVIAIHYSSLWLGFAMIVQGIALYAHFLRIIGDQISSTNYIHFNNALTFLMVACILAGLIATRLGDLRAKGKTHLLTRSEIA